MPGLPVVFVGKWALGVGTISSIARSLSIWCANCTPGTEAFQKEESAKSVRTFAGGAVVGTLLAMPMYKLKEHTLWMEVLHAALITTGVLSPIYASAIIDDGKIIAEHVPAALTLTAVLAGTGGMTAAYLLPACEATTILGTASYSFGFMFSGWLVFEMASRWANATDYLIRTHPEYGPDCACCFQLLGLVLSSKMISDGLMITTSGLPGLTWINILILTWPPTLPCRLSYFTPTPYENAYRFQMWLSIAVGTLFTGVLFNHTPIAWMVASTNYMRFQGDWGAIKRLEDGDNTSVTAVPAAMYAAFGGEGRATGEASQFDTWTGKFKGGWAVFRETRPEEAKKAEEMAEKAATAAEKRAKEAVKSL